MKSKKIKSLLLFLLLFSQLLNAQTANDKVFGMWGHGKQISKSIIQSMPFLRGWNFTFYWRDLQPKKDSYNWKVFDDQIMTAINNNLYVGFMVWVGQFTPEWVYDVDGVQKVTFNDPLHNTAYYPYYLNPAYKADYMAMLKAVGEHIKSLPPTVRKKVLFWMSAEGSTGDVTPYKTEPLDAQYTITDDQWMEFKTQAWTYLYNFGNSLTPKLNILINQANNGKYFNYLLQNFHDVWFKTGSLAHAYQFDGEKDYYNRLQRVVRPDNNGMANRLRGESEELQNLGWFQQAPQQNNFALVASCLHFGMDIMNVREEITGQIGGNVFPFAFFNKYAGQRDPATAAGAFCVLRDVLDVADTKRFPEDKYGPLSDNPIEGGQKNKKAISANNAEDQALIRRTKNMSSVRKQNILKEFLPYGAKNGPTPEEEKIIYKDDDKLEPKLRKANLRSDLLDKYNNDLGIDLIPGNYFKFLEQYSPNTTSRGHWRVGPVDQPFGRYARGFDHTTGMNEMFFTLDKNFYSNSGLHKLKIAVTYFDKGTGEWSLNYYDGKAKTAAYTVHCTNTGRWITKQVELAADVSHRLEHNTDFTLKYQGGDNTIFGMIEVTR